MDNNKKQRVVIIIQARMGATRLPGKPMKTVLGKPLLSYLFERVKQVKQVDKVILATSQNAKDNEIVEFCREQGISCMRGSEEDVLERYTEAAKMEEADVIIRLTADCPLIDPRVIEKVLSVYLENFPQYDYVANTLKRTYPRGMDVEVFSRRALEYANAHASKEDEREHVTPYLFRHPEKFKCTNVANTKDLSGYRLTVDTIEDFTLVSKLLEAIYPRKVDFTLNDLLKLLEEHPAWSKINAHVKQKQLTHGPR